MAFQIGEQRGAPMLLGLYSGLHYSRSVCSRIILGDALYHIAILKKVRAAEEKLSLMEEDVEADPLFDEDEII